MSPSLRLLAALLCLVALLALASVNGRVLVVALPILVYLGAGLLMRPEELSLDISRSLGAPRTRPEVPVEVTVEVTNRGRRIDELLLADVLPPSLAVSHGSLRLFASLGAGEQLRWTYVVRGGRGEFAWERLLVEASGHCSIFGRQEEHALRSRMLVLPVVERLASVRIQPRQTRGFAGPLPGRTAGSGTRFFGVREYRLGDPLRRINSRLTARHPFAVYTNELEQERIADVGIVLDARAQSYPQPHGEALLEASVAAAGSLADVFLADGNRVALLVYGYGMQRVPPGSGKTQRQRILLQLARARTGTNYALESLDYLPARMFPARSQIVMVSPLQRADTRVLRRIRSRGYSLLVVSPNPLPLEGGGAEDRSGAGGERPRSSQRLEAGALARRIVALERSLLLAELRRAGIRVVDWPVGAPLAATLRSSLARQPLELHFRGLWR